MHRMTARENQKILLILFLHEDSTNRPLKYSRQKQ
jgi:hypothetical protein